MTKPELMSWNEHTERMKEHNKSQKPSNGKYGREGGSKVMWLHRQKEAN
jgi:hypothetical protein